MRCLFPPARLAVSLSAALLLSSCAYIKDDSVQDVTLRTPGAENAICHVMVERLRHRVHPPETIVIGRSKEDLVVDCRAPGNRRRKVVVEPSVNKHSTRGNLFNGILPGAAVDYVSGAMFTYPSVIDVDFTSAKPTPESLPDQNSADILQPEDYPLEEFLPGTPRMSGDQYNTPFELTPRQKSSARVPSTPAQTGKMIQTGGISPDKGTLKSLNPAGPPATPYPGQ